MGGCRSGWYWRGSRSPRFEQRIELVRPLGLHCACGRDLGNARRNALVTPCYALMNVGVAKSTTFERISTIQLSTTFLNAVTHLNYGSQNATVNNVNGGVIPSRHAFLSAGSARSGQLGLRWMF